MTCCFRRRYLLVIRSVHLLSLIVITGILSFLTCLINNNQLGLSARLIILNTLSAIATAYFLASFYPLIHPSRTLFKLSIVADILAIGLLSSIQTLLRVSKVPESCVDLTRQSYRPGDRVTPPAPGFDTIRFGNPGQHGELDKYCPAAKAAYYLSTINTPLVFFCIVSSVLFLRATKGLPPGSCSCSRGLSTNKSVTTEATVEIPDSSINGSNNVADAPNQIDPPPYSEAAPGSVEGTGCETFHGHHQGRGEVV